MRWTRTVYNEDFNRGKERRNKTKGFQERLG